jgi:hypothetical protein
MMFKSMLKNSFKYYIYIYIHTHTHTHIYMCVWKMMYTKIKFQISFDILWSSKRKFVIFL